MLIDRNTMTSRTTTLIKCTIAFNARGLSVVPIDHNDDVINVEFDSEADVINKLTQMASTMGVNQLGLISYGLVAIMLDKSFYNLYNTLTLVNSDGNPIYVFKMPPSMVNTHSVHYSTDDSNHRRYIEALSITKHMDTHSASCLDIMYIANDIIHFRSVIDPKTPIAEFPNELKLFLYKAESPAREIQRETLCAGCYQYMQQDRLPLNLESELEWKPIYYVRYGRKRTSGHTIAKIAITDLPFRITETVKKHLTISKAQVISYFHTSPWELDIKSPTCLLFYGDTVNATLKANGVTREAELRQGDLLFVNNCALTIKVDEDDVMDMETSIFLLIK